MAVFSVDYFKSNPKPFFEVARRLYRPHAKPTLSHYFIRLLNDKKILRRHYTQNVDDLERLSGLPEEMFVEAHGTFHTGHCMKCRKFYTFEYMRDRIVRKEVPMCTNKSCNGVVKPDVVFFGEDMPSHFYRNISRDFDACDLLIIMGTSLQVLPFCGLIHKVRSNCPRLYLNREFMNDDTPGIMAVIMRFMVAGFRRSYLRWGHSDNTRDVFVRGDADSSVLKLAQLLGWSDELLRLKEENDARLDLEQCVPPEILGTEAQPSTEQTKPGVSDRKT
ncbi:unnamed protein product [Calicophoron daubneyi]